MTGDASESVQWRDGTPEQSTVIIVDDSEFFANMMAREIEEQSDFETRAYYDGETVLEDLPHQDVACIVSDYHMQPMNGIELLGNVREAQGALPFIILTGQGGEGVAIDAIRLGATDYVTKETIVEGSEFSLLLNRIEKAVSHAQALTELSHRKELLEEQRDNLDILNEVLRHDIRNDLQIITAYSEMLADHIDDDGATYLHTVQESAKNAIELTMTAGRIADVMLTQGVERQKMNIRTVLHGEIDAIRSSDQTATIDVEGDLFDQTVFADQMLDAVFRNLLKNAIQHTEAERPEIVVATTVQDDMVEVHISDNGPGVSDERKDAIFGKGEQGLQSNGTGMGLHLVDTLVSEYGGEVWVEDNDPQGAIFIVALPIAD
ncbi:Signal transduction histidine kinase [Halanaeroarchaeum sp. HSR-CO]|uniref:hybrid sensor histidine kinase/response regulator n=1 Tax=Halanaeroarchaeum sp. HSR-CO TaxID=2866382 RepID=UPI00217DB364|nr:hybrid sensor histidine kinase/response regulator [Halanaeroarchaeum sp. HSR-CO]UWG47700.1 Signal transduction histidine kinase [Halanaeroarchaeum sp. HSR-CO]